MSKSAMRGHVSERGVALILALLLLLLLLGLAFVAASWNLRGLSGQERRERSQEDYARARSAAANVEAWLQYDLPLVYQQDYPQAEQMATGAPSSLDGFDAATLAPANSYPVAVVDPNTGQLVRSTYPLSQCTSLLGQPQVWGQARAVQGQQFAVARGFGANEVNVAAIYEFSRRAATGSQGTQYTLHYIVDGHSGSNRVRPEGELLLNTQSCSVTINSFTEGPDPNNSGMVQFCWNVTAGNGTVVQVTITPDVGNDKSTLAGCKGNVSPPQSATTYTLTATGSSPGQRCTQQATVQVASSLRPCPEIYCNSDCGYWPATIPGNQPCDPGGRTKQADAPQCARDCEGCPLYCP